MAKITPYPPGHVFTPDEQAARKELLAKRRDIMMQKQYAQWLRGDLIYQRSDLHQQQLFEASAPVRTARANWANLSRWKKTRWQMCAWVKRFKNEDFIGVGNISGLNLYIKCHIQQGITTDRQPISPCSRRATDPTASPYDYTP